MGTPRSRSLGQTAGPLHLVLVGANHRTCAVGVRERLLAQVTNGRVQTLRTRRAEVEDVILLRTCNRVEIYALTPSPSTALLALRRLFDLPTPIGSLYELQDVEAASHLLRVASGLDSVALGEPQIAIQLRSAAETQRTSSKRPSPLTDMFERAARLAPRLRHLAGVDRVPTSASHAAIRYAQDVVGLPNPRITLLGTGKMARLAAEAIRTDARLVVVNRDAHKARATAMHLGARAAPLSQLPRVMEHTDVLIAATSSTKRLIGRRLLLRTQETRGGSPLWIIDLGVPRNVDPLASTIKGVRIATIDDLAPWAGSPPHPGMMARVERRIRQEAETVLESLRPHAADPVAALRRSAERIRRTEVEHALARMPHATALERAVVDKMADRLVNRLLHAPTRLARRLQAEGRETALADLLPRDVPGGRP